MYGFSYEFNDTYVQTFGSYLAHIYRFPPLALQFPFLWVRWGPSCLFRLFATLICYMGIYIPFISIQICLSWHCLQKLPIHYAAVNMAANSDQTGKLNRGSGRREVRYCNVWITLDDLWWLISAFEHKQIIKQFTDCSFNGHWHGWHWVLDSLRLRK